MYNYSLTDNAELLKRRLKSLEDSKEQLDESLKQQIAYYRTLEREMYKLKSEIGQLARQKDRHSLYVLFFLFIVEYHFFLRRKTVFTCLRFVANLAGG